MLTDVRYVMGPVLLFAGNVSNAMQFEELEKPRLTNAQLDRRIAEESARLQSQDASIRRAAGEALYDLCMEYEVRAKAAIPALINCLGDDDEDVREQAECGLHYCGKAAIKPLVGALAHKNPLLRRHAAGSLARGGEHVSLALPKLRKTLKDSDMEVRINAALAVGLASDGNDLDITPLIDLAKSANTQDRAAALHALGNISVDDKLKEKSHKWRELVREGIKDQDSKVRWSAFHALAGSGIDELERTRLLVSGIVDSDETVVWMCLGGLDRINKQGSSVSIAVPSLGKLVRKKFARHVLSDAAKLLGEIGADANGVKLVRNILRFQ